MFDQSHGLRFDIYERVHLPQDLPGIAELEEVELLPEIQVIQREDRAELYGQLLLTGLYRSEDDRTQRLEHAIPVEITVPLTRVSSLEDIGVEIENFDIDLLTMRSINITGVLSLRGIGGAEALPVWQQEEYTVAYAPEEERALAGTGEVQEHEGDALYENSLWTFGEGAVEEPAEEYKVAGAESTVNKNNPVFSAQEKDKGLTVHTHSFKGGQDEAQTDAAGFWPKTEAWSPDHFSNERKEPENPAANAANENVVLSEAEADAPNAFAAVEDNASFGEELYPEALSGSENAPEADAAIAEEDPASADIASIPEEKPDLKIALGSKKEPQAAEKEQLTFSALLNSSRSRRELEDLQAAEVVPAAPEASPEAAVDKEWKSRFIGGFEGADLFRKVRLCIVQREETLDTIAEKYSLSARELVMYNRLSGQSIEEGQVLYIP